jgi:transposase-like protein
MSDRFYSQMIDATGWAPGFRNQFTKPTHITRRRRVAWTEESKAQAIEMYSSEEPTPENSMEIVKYIAEELGESPNGVRMILTKAGVYVKKTPAARSSSGSSAGSTGGGRVNVAAAQEELTSAIKDAGQEPDDAIISKLTGKAAQYFASLINAINE